MPKVSIEPTSRGYRLCLDGVDITHAIKADGVEIWWEHGHPCVRLTLMPVELRADLPDAVVATIEAAV